MSECSDRRFFIKLVNDALGRRIIGQSLQREARNLQLHLDASNSKSKFNVNMLSRFLLSAFNFVAMISALAAAIFAGKAYEQVKRQADAAEAGNAPVLYRDEIKAEYNETDKSIRFVVLWKNGGRNPSMQTHLESSCSYDTPDGRRALEFDGQKGHQGVLGPGQVAFTDLCRISISIDNIMSGKASSILIFGRACYKDIGNDKWHVTESFSRITDIQMNENHDYVNYLIQSEGKYNCADENCEDYNFACDL